MGEVCRSKPHHLKNLFTIMLNTVECSTCKTTVTLETALNEKWASTSFNGDANYYCRGCAKKYASEKAMKGKESGKVAPYIYDTPSRTQNEYGDPRDIQPSLVDNIGHDLLTGLKLYRMKSGRRLFISDIHEPFWVPNEKTFW